MSWDFSQKLTHFDGSALNILICEYPFDSWAFHYVFDIYINVNNTRRLLQLIKHPFVCLTFYQPDKKNESDVSDNIVGTKWPLNSFTKSIPMGQTKIIVLIDRNH